MRERNEQVQSPTVNAAASARVDGAATTAASPASLRRIVLRPFGEGLDGDSRRADLLGCTTAGMTLVVDQPMRLNSRFFVKVKLSSVALVVYEVKQCEPLGRRFRVEAEWRDLTGSATDRAANAEAVVRALLAA